MFFPESTLKIWLYAKATDMRKSFDGLIALAKNQMKESPLSKPSLYLSDFLEQHRGNYYDALTGVRTSSNLVHWIKFFLTAVIETAESGKKTFQAILLLRNELESKMVTLGKRAENARALLVALYGKPIVSVNDVLTLLGITHKAANGLVGQFVELDILEEITGFQRNRMYVFRRYLALFG